AAGRVRGLRKSGGERCAALHIARPLVHGGCMRDGDPHAANSAPHAAHPAGPDRRRPRTVTSADRNPRTDVAQYVARNRLEPFHRALWGLAVAVFGDDATVVPHLRTVAG